MRTKYYANGTPYVSSFTAPWLNVKDFGAKGDGATNDKVALQSAITAALSRGVSNRGIDLFFPSGVYNYSALLTCVGANVRLHGSGRGSTILMATFTTGDCIQIGDGTSGKANITIDNMEFWCTGARTTGAMININNVSDVVIDQFVINNYFQGIFIQGASLKVNLTKGEFNNGHTADGVGIQVTNGAGGDTYIGPDIVMSNNPANKPLAGIQISQSGHCSIIRCNVTSFVKGLHVNPVTSQDVSYLFIDHSLFDSCGTHGAHFNGTTAASSRIRSVMCVNSWFSGTTTTGGPGTGIEFTAASSSIVDALSFVGCRILNNQRHGVTINAGPLNISFTDCTIAGNGVETATTYDGISIAANVSNLSAMNCKIGQAGTAGNTQRYAINIAAGTSANLQIFGNDCEPNLTVGTIGYINSGVLTGGGNQIAFNTPGISMGMDSATVAASGGLNTTETVISAPMRIGANALRAGNTIRFTAVGTCTTTAANVTTFRVKMGTAGTTSDGVIMTFATTAAGTTGTTIPFRVVIDITCRTVGGSATFYGSMTLYTNAITGIVALQLTNIYLGTAATGSTITNNYITLTHQTAATTTTNTFQQVLTEIAVT